MENKFVVDYDKKIVTLHFNGEQFEFDLNEGDVGDFWYSFTDKHNVVRDINFHQEDETQKPGLSVYNLTKDENNNYSINTSDSIYISAFEQIGNPINYFGENNEDYEEE